MDCDNINCKGGKDANLPKVYHLPAIKNNCISSCWKKENVIIPLPMGKVVILM